MGANPGEGWEAVDVFMKQLGDVQMPPEPFDNRGVDDPAAGSALAVPALRKMSVARIREANLSLRRLCIVPDNNSKLRIRQDSDAGTRASLAMSGCSLVQVSAPTSFVCHWVGAS